MGVKRTLDYDQLVVDGDMSSDITSASTNIMNTDRVGYQLSYSGTPTGTFSVQVSNDESVWVDVTFDSTPTAAGQAGTDFLEVETAAKFVRLVYTATSGTGSLDAHITAKSISG